MPIPVRAPFEDYVEDITPWDSVLLGETVMLNDEIEIVYDIRMVSKDDINQNVYEIFVDLKDWYGNITTYKFLNTNIISRMLYLKN